MTLAHPAIQANDLALKLYARGKFGEAESSYRRAIELVPAGAYPEAHNNYGILLHNMRRMPEAVAHYRRALELAPTFAQAASNLAAVCEAIGDHDNAIKFYRFALQHQPGIGVIWHNLAGMYRERGDFDLAYECYAKCMELDPKNFEAHCSVIYSIDMDPRKTPEERAAAKLKWSETHAYKSECPLPVHADPERKLRVGYVSGDFRMHSVAFAFSDVLFGHDRRQFEVFAYSTTVAEDVATERMSRSVDGWRKIVGLTDQEVFDQIRTDKIDILVDLSGYTALNKLKVFTMWPAPVQLHAWGYLNDPGLPQIPHNLTDPVIDPEGKGVHLPCVFHFRPPAAPDVGPLPMFKNGHITLGYLGRWMKVTPDVASLWHDVMMALPGARLVLKDRRFVDPGARQAALKLLQLPPERVTLLEQTGHYPHLDDHNRADLGLDPWPTNGGVSSMESLWMGLPMVTLPADRASGRVTASLLTTLGLDGLFVANSRDDYIAKVVAAVSNPRDLARIRGNLREKMKKTVICDAGLYVAHVDRAYRMLWRQACEATTH